MEIKSSVILPSRASLPTPTCVRQPAVPLHGKSRTGSGRKHWRSPKTDSSPQHRNAVDAVAGLSSRPLQKHSDPSDQRHRNVSSRVGHPEPEPETVSLSHYYRRHHHRARNHSRAMHQVAEWIENAGIVNTGTVEDTAVVRHRQRTHHHIHEHHHHHHHYHYSVSGII